MQVGDLVQYVDPATGGNPMPLVLLGVILDMKVKKTMVGGNSAVVHALVHWGNHNNQQHWLPSGYLEVIK